MEVHIHDTEQVIEICEKHLKAQCEYKEHCPRHHWVFPYLWQVCCKGWVSLTSDECCIIESFYSQPNIEEKDLKLVLPNASGEMIPVDAIINFSVMKIAVCVQSGSEPSSSREMLSIRRLSTPSYVQSALETGPIKPPKLYTQWRWYYEENAQWIEFGKDEVSPMQWTLEEKFLAGQELFRFVVTCPPVSPQIYMLKFSDFILLNPATETRTSLRRRPLLLSPTQTKDDPPRKPIPFKENLPSNWFPLNQSSDYELVPLNPDSMEFHLVKSEFVRSLPKERTVHDVFRLQNAFLWHKYHSKKTFLQQKLVDPNELQLFHGTSPESTVQAIFRQNFDWRLCGRNNTLYGRGTYFAKDASYSDKYTGVPNPQQYRWMFLARVIVGRYVKGRKEYLRPPSTDATNPMSDLYESCVDNESNPNIYVIFDSDQCYPEYAISYR